MFVTSDTETIERRRAQHVVDSVSVQDKGRIGNIVFPRGLDNEIFCNELIFQSAPATVRVPPAALTK